MTSEVHNNNKSVHLRYFLILKLTLVNLIQVFFMRNAKVFQYVKQYINVGFRVRIYNNYDHKGTIKALANTASGGKMYRLNKINFNKM